MTNPTPTPKFTLQVCFDCGKVASCDDQERDVDGPHPGCSEFAPPDVFMVPVCVTCQGLTTACAVCTELAHDGICENCEAAGYWMDPAGGVHAPGDDDPAAQYK